MTDKTFVLRIIPIMGYNTITDKMEQAKTEKGIPATFSYKGNLFNLLRQAPDGKHKKIKDVVQVEELLQRIIAIPAESAIILKDSEYQLIKETFESFEYGASSSELKQMYMDIVNAPALDVTEEVVAAAKKD